MGTEQNMQVVGNVKAAFLDGMKLTPTGWTAEGDRGALEMVSYDVRINGSVTTTSTTGANPTL